MNGSDMEPIMIRGRSLADSWWGKAWNANLESYSDYSNRLPRGRTYIRNGSIIDLRIHGNTVESKVRGSSPRPYTVKVSISALNESEKKSITDRCAGRVSNIEALVNGQFPPEIGELFLSQNGLFPRPSEIKFSCSCPDYAYMCKHVAAVLYGIGKKFDSDPSLFFSLRGIDVESLVGKTAQAKLESMLANADCPSDRILRPGRVSELFGIALDDDNDDADIAICSDDRGQAECDAESLDAEKFIMAEMPSAIAGCLERSNPPCREELSRTLSEMFFSIVDDRFKSYSIDPNIVLEIIACRADYEIRAAAVSPHREADYLIADLIASAKEGRAAFAFTDNRQTDGTS